MIEDKNAEFKREYVDDIKKALGFSQTTAIVTIAALLDKGLIIKVGNGNKTKYKVV